MAPRHGITFRITGLNWEESTGHRWIPLEKGSHLVRHVSLCCLDPQTTHAIAQFYLSVCQSSGSSPQYWIPWKQITYHTKPTEGARPQPWNVTNHANSSHENLYKDFWVSGFLVRYLWPCGVSWTILIECLPQVIDIVFWQNEITGGGEIWV